MATGRLSTPVQLGATNTTLYTVPTGFYAVFNVSLCNTGTSAVTVRLAVASTTSPGITEWIEFDQAIPPKSTFERTGLVLSSTTGAKYITVYASTANVNVNIYGIETSTV